MPPTMFRANLLSVTKACLSVVKTVVDALYIRYIL